MLHQALEITSKLFAYNFISTQKKVYFPEDITSGLWIIVWFFIFKQKLLT
jgi:hypothetical protein